jgi:hypothetical protein
MAYMRFHSVSNTFPLTNTPDSFMKKTAVYIGEKNIYYSDFLKKSVLNRRMTVSFIIPYEFHYIYTGFKSNLPQLIKKLLLPF